MLYLGRDYFNIKDPGATPSAMAASEGESAASGLSLRSFASGKKGAFSKSGNSDDGSTINVQTQKYSDYKE